MTRKLVVTLSIPAAITSKSALTAKTAARAVLKTYPGATLVTETIGSAATTLGAYLAANASAHLLYLGPRA